VYAEIEITNCQNATFSIYSTGGTEIINCAGNNYTHTTNLVQSSVIKNTSFPYLLQFGPTTFPQTSCIDIITRVYHNGVLYETKNYSIGNLSTLTQCPNSNYVNEIYSIIAN
jgi:hypothetical protein